MTTCLAVIVVMACTSSAQCVLNGEQSLLVNSLIAAAVIITVRDFSLATFLHRQRHRRDRQIGHRIDAAFVEPVARERGGDVGLVFGVAGLDGNRLA